MALTSASGVPAAVIAAISDAEARGAALLINIHELVTSSPGGNQTLVSDLVSVLNHAQTRESAGALDTVTMSAYTSGAE